MPEVSTSPTAAPFAIPPLRRAAPPPLNPALADLAPQVRDAYRELLLFMGDSELVLGHRHSEWTGFAPSAEEDIAFSSIAQDEMGHAHLYYALVVGADSGDAVDRLALDRGPRQFRHLPLLHAANGDWFFTTARLLYWDVFEDVFLRAAVDSTLPLLAGASQRILNEEQYHLEHAEQWLELMSSRAPQRRRLAAALARVTAIGGSPVGPLLGLAGLGPALRTVGLARHYEEALLGRLAHAGWAGEHVDPVRAGLRANRGSRPPGLQQLHRDLTGLRRAHPGARW
ncbi:MAG: 1,2-phenylacetyl-CoA epoxidase subunit PaaC [Candidatus Dormibacteria bacterium]